MMNSTKRLAVLTLMMMLMIMSVVRSFTPVQRTHRIITKNVALRNNSGIIKGRVHSHLSAHNTNTQEITSDNHVTASTSDNDRNEDSNNIQMNDDQDEGETKKETLRFGGTMSYKSKPLPFPSTSSSSSSRTTTILKDFFTNAEHQKILLCGGYDPNNTKIAKTKEELKFLSTPIETISINDLHPILKSRWIERCQRITECVEPDFTVDTVTLARTQGIGVVGVTIHPTSIIGSKVISSSSSSSLLQANISTITNDRENIIMPEYQEYQGVLISDEPRATGPPFLVWLFNKLSYGGNPDKLKKKEKEEDVNNNNCDDDDDDGSSRFLPTKNENRENIAYIRVWTEEARDDNNHRQLILRAESYLQMDIKFPAGLLRFFPMKKEKGEQILSDAILVALEKNLFPAMDRFCDAYLDWIKTASQDEEHNE